jgi:hypothetical protein
VKVVRIEPFDALGVDDRRDVQRILDELLADVDVTPQQWLDSNPVIYVLDEPGPHKTPRRMAAPLNPEIRVGDSIVAVGWTATTVRGAWSLDPPRQIPLPEPIHVAGRVVRWRSSE